MDLDRLQKALQVEADNGFNDMQGNQYRFSEFICLSFGQPSPDIPRDRRQQLRDLGGKFADYRHLGFADRRNLLAEARQLLSQTKKYSNTAPATPIVAETPTPANTTKTTSKKTAKKVVAKAATKASSSAKASSTGKSKGGARGAIDLDQPVQYLPGIGPKSADRLAKLNLFTVRDVLYYYPRDHIDYAKQVNIRELTAGDSVTIVGQLKSCNCFTSPRNSKLTIFDLTLKDSSGQMRLSRFFMGARFASRGWQENQKRQFPKGATVAASGLVKESKYGMTLDNPELEVLESPDQDFESSKIGKIVPIYPLTEGVPADLVRRAVVASLGAVEQLQETLPGGLRQQYELAEIRDAIAGIHFPDSGEVLAASRKRLVFDEFFYLQLGLLNRRRQQQGGHTDVVLEPTGKLLSQFYDEVLPFTLTGAQQRVVTDILSNLQTTIPMNRLVQGDVGSGKTVVAVIALLAAIQAGYQGALMAPTEVLAEQHYRKLVHWFNQLHLPVELLTGSTKTAKRREIHRSLQSGELPLLVGTHALIEDPVQFDRLGLVVIDEQHRFGVQQRARLTQKGENPHILTMTATPIPRTMALTLHGDLDVSQIDELPPGRKAIKTTIVTPKKRQEVYDMFRREIALGRQVYVVLPLVDESEKLDLKSAIVAHQDFQTNVFPEYKVGLLHGKMTSAEKDAAITAFRDNETHILVSTTVVEVGVDVPNASVMMIEHAERFGLSQLHQLRGRVGRGAAQSFCLLMTASRSETSMQRLKVLEQSQDGFFISEMDLRFRGPGEVLGSRQSGLPDFALASLVEDQEVLEVARDAAEKAMEKDPTLAKWPAMRAELEYRYTRLLGGAILT
ncbi:ATP-dependent DNA helicase RecG [filamentous cyanobacterium LEGE 11480]|uniref:ATP-dependent DNA helicase RecG n=1 Tax=Romeriopsis navalis LEGE 11480 TaxID=2777977 RepID=A0A928VQH5_9CYAN|nr:ATP-dependent DNA helicase RecG [Romeriopsis navalis]MBE9031928.1 ATP-dependent DNA helicase RecG [Romeriopsis navalis LEGE 11480]